MNLRKSAFLIPLLFYAWFYHPVPYDNVTSRFNLTQALARDHTLFIDNYHTNTFDKAFRNGHYYSDKAPALSVAGAASLFLIDRITTIAGYYPEIPILRYLLRLLWISLPSAFLCLLLYQTNCKIHGAAGMPLAAVLSYALATPATIYSTLYYGHQLAAVLFFGAFLALLKSRKYHAHTGRALFLSGLLAGIAITVEYPMALAALLLLAFAAVDQPRRRRIVILVAGMIGPLIMLASYHTFCFGHPLTTGYAYKFLADHAAVHSRGLAGIARPHLAALWGITCGRERGLFVFTPVLLLVIPGIIVWIKNKHNRFEALFSLCTILLFLLFHASFLDWQAGWCFGPRHTVPALPFFALAIAALPRSIFAITLPILLLPSALTTFLGLSTTPHIPVSFHNPLLTFFPTLLQSSLRSVTLTSLAGLPRLADALLPILLAALLLLLAYLHGSQNATRSQSNRRHTILAAGCAIPLLGLWIIWIGFGPSHLTAQNHLDLGQIFLAAEIPEPALEHFNQTLELQPGDSQAMHGAIRARTLIQTYPPSPL